MKYDKQQWLAFNEKEWNLQPLPINPAASARIIDGFSESAVEKRWNEPAPTEASGTRVLQTLFGGPVVFSQQ